VRHLEYLHLVLEPADRDVEAVARLDAPGTDRILVRVTQRDARERLLVRGKAEGGGATSLPLLLLFFW
jgi:hypothetical protein